MYEKVVKVISENNYKTLLKEEEKFLIFDSL